MRKLDTVPCRIKMKQTQPHTLTQIKSSAQPWCGNVWRRCRGDKEVFGVRLDLDFQNTPCSLLDAKADGAITDRRKAHIS